MPSSSAFVARDTDELAAREIGFERAPFVGPVSGPVCGDAIRGARARCVPARAARTARRARRPCGSARERQRLMAVAQRTLPATSRPRCSPTARAPECSSSIGRCQQATTRSDRGAPSASISSTGDPHSAVASSAGLPMVALAKQNVGLRVVVLADAFASVGGGARHDSRRCRARVWSSSTTT